MAEGSRARPKATELLLARRCFYGGAEIRIGTSEIEPAITEQDRQRTLGTARGAAKRYRGDGDPTRVAEAIRQAVATHVAAHRILEERQEKIVTARRANKAATEYMRACGTDSQREVVRMIDTGALNEGIALPWGEEFVVGIAPVTSEGKPHSDLLGYTAARIRHLLARVESHVGRKRPFTDFEVASAALGFEPEWLQQRASMFSRGLKTEALRRERLFTLSPGQVLSSEVPDPFDFEPFPTRGRLADTIGGFTGPNRNDDGLIPESEIRPSASGTFIHIPGIYIPFIEEWHGFLDHAKRDERSILRRLNRAEQRADGAADQDKNTVK